MKIWILYQSVWWAVSEKIRFGFNFVLKWDLNAPIRTNTEFGILISAQIPPVL